MLLSIGMMVKNEEKHLEECLESLHPIREELDTELIIVDTGSDDNTVEIAKKFTDKVFFHEWNDHFSEMRNTVISYSSGDWYFSLDGDEIVANPQGFINFFKSGKYKEYNTGLVTQKNYTNLKENRYTKILVPRLFKNDEDFHFEGAVHNQPQYKKPIIELDTILDHYGYVSSDRELIEKKFQRTSTILKQELEKDPDNVYYWFQLSKSYNMHNDNEEALEAIEEAYNVARKNDLDLSKRMYIYIQLSKMYLLNNRYKKSEKIAKKALNIKDGYVDLYYYLARAQLMQNKKEKSLINFKKFIKLINNYDQSISKKDTSVDDEMVGNDNTAYRFIVALSADLEKGYKNALSAAFKVDLKSQLKHVFRPFITICINSKNYKKLKKFYDKKLDTEKLKNKYINTLEQLRLNIDKETDYRISKVFTDKQLERRDYYLLNQVRKLIYTKRNYINIDKLLDIDLNNKADYFGDVVYYLIKNSKDNSYKLLTKVKEKKLNKFIRYLNNKYDDVNKYLLDFIENNSDVQDISKLRVNKAFGRYLLAFDNNYVENKKYIINKYLDAGIRYLKKLYKRNILENQLVNNLKNEEEGFLLYMYLAKKNKYKDKKAYVKYLRKALNIFPPMKKGVELLLKEFKNEQQHLKGDLEDTKKELRKKIENFVNQMNLQKAKKLIKKYESIIGEDSELYSMKGIIAIKNNNLDLAKKLFEQGLDINDSDLDLLYNLGYVYEELNEYFKAVETYEKMVFNMEEKEERKEIIKHINSLEKNYWDKIQCQLGNRQNTNIKYVENPKYRYIHLMYDNFYCNKFIHFVNKHFDEKNHIYLLLVPDNHEFKHINFDGVDNIRIINLKENINELVHYMRNTNKIFIHYLFDHICKLLVKLNIKKELYWVFFGGDLYNYIEYKVFDKYTAKLFNSDGYNKVEKNNIDYIYRKVVIRNLSYVLTANKGDFQILKSNFITKAKLMPLLNPRPIDFKMLNKLKDNEQTDNKYVNRIKNYSYAILAGNSANPTNNHLDLLNLLRSIKGNNFCIVMPLSYSGPKKYVNYIIKKGKEIFGKRFIPLKEFIPYEDYISILKQINIGLFNHNRQQALATIISLIYLEKKVYIKTNITSFEYLNSKDIKVFDIKNIENKNIKDIIRFNNENKLKNKQFLKKYFNNNRVLNFLEDIFLIH